MNTTGSARLLIIPVLLICIWFASTGCSKGGDDTPHVLTDTLARFSLYIDDNYCTSFWGPGGLEVGSPPRDGKDSINLTVKVMKTGYWEFKPVSIAGLTFEGSGYITDTTVQDITIRMIGMPTEAGTFDFPLNFPTNVCKPKLIIWPKGTYPPPASTTYFYRAKIGGVQYIEEVKAGNGIEAGSDVNGSNEVTLTAGIGPETYPFPLGKTSLSITKGTLYNYFSVSDIQFQSFFNPGYYPYTMGPHYAPFLDNNGLTVAWIDPQGKTWTSYNGTGTQGGNSSMKIVEVIPDPDPLNFYVRVKIHFTCKLYKEGIGEMTQLTDGEFVGLFGKF